NGVKDVRVDHSAAAELNPPRLRTDSAPRALAEDARDLELGRWLGEGEVRRPQPGVNRLPEVRTGERLDGAGEVAEGNTPVNDEALDLVEHGEVAGVGCIAPVTP